MIYYSHHRIPKKLISCFTSTFAKPASIHHLKEAWEKELGINILEELWEDSLANIHNCSINSKNRLIQFKVVHRSHYSKTKLSKIFDSVSPTCDRCETAEGSLSHLFLQCPVLNNFWSHIFHWFSQQYNTHIPPDCILALFGCSEGTKTLPTYQRQALKIGMVVAKKFFILNWKSSATPCFKRGLDEMLSVARMEQIRYNKNNFQTLFQKMRKPFLAILDRTA